MQLCPACSRPLDSPSGGVPPRGWVSLALLRHLAEAGYFADRLRGEGFRADVFEHDEYDPRLERAVRRYILRVDAEQAAAAADQFAEELRATTDAEDEPRDGRAPRLPAWAGYAVLGVVLVAGLASTWKRVPEPSPAAGELWRTLERLGTSFQSESRPGQARYRLLFRGAEQRADLECDWNGDGQADSVERFAL
jgi:hypothetical protein